MNDDQFKKLMHAISLDLAVKLKPPALVNIDKSQLRGAPVDASYILHMGYGDWAKAIEGYLVNPHYPAS
jgi:hypothetical protein